MPPVKIGGLVAWIAIGTEESRSVCHAPKYSEDGKTLTCWIASEAGKTFSVQWGDRTPTHPTRGEVYLDGLHCDQCPVCNHLACDPESLATIHGFPSSQNTIREFKFAAVELTENEALAGPSTLNDHMGKITLVVKRVIVEKKKKDRYRRPRNSNSSSSSSSNLTLDMPRTAPIYEKEKMVGTVAHRVASGEEKEVKFENGYNIIPQETIATFIFKYTSLELLQANGIIPAPTPTPSPSSCSRPSSSSSSSIPLAPMTKRAITESLVFAAATPFKRLYNPVTLAITSTARTRAVRRRPKTGMATGTRAENVANAVGVLSAGGAAPAAIAPAGARASGAARDDAGAGGGASSVGDQRRTGAFQTAQQRIPPPSIQKPAAATSNSTRKNTQIFQSAQRTKPFSTPNLNLNLTKNINKRISSSSSNEAEEGMTRALKRIKIESSVISLGGTNGDGERVVIDLTEED